MKRVKRELFLGLLAFLTAVAVIASFVAPAYGSMPASAPSSGEDTVDIWKQGYNPPAPTNMNLEWTGPLYSAGAAIQETAKPFTSRQGIKSLIRKPGNVKGRDINTVTRTLAGQTRNTARVLETTGKYLDIGDKALTVVESAGALAGGDVVGVAQANANNVLSGAAASGGAWAVGKTGAAIGFGIGGPPGAVIGGGAGAVIGAVGGSYVYDKYGKPVVDDTADKISSMLRDAQAAAEKDATRLRTDLAVIDQVRRQGAAASAPSSGEDTIDIWRQRQNLPVSKDEARMIHEEAEKIRLNERLRAQQASAPKPEKKLVSITISPKSGALTIGGTQAFSATGIYSDNSTNNITGLVQWAGGDGSSFTAKKGGTFTLTATYQGISGSATIIVKKLPTALVVSPAQKTIKINETASFTAKVTFNDGSAEDVTGKAGWAPMNPFTGTAAGAYTITAGYENVSGSAAVTVQKTLKAVSVAPAERTIKISESASFTATAIFDDGSTYDVTGEATWSPGSSFTGTKAGTFIIAANYKGLSGKAKITVTPKDSASGGYDPRKDPNIPKDKTQVDIAHVDKLGDEFQKDTGKKPDKDKDKTKAPLTPTAPQQTDASNTTGTKPDETTQPPYPPYPPYGPPPTDRTGPTKDWTGWATDPTTHSTGQSTTQTTTQTTGQSTAQSTTQPPATGGGTTPVDTRTVDCSTTTKSGGNTPATITVNVSKAPGVAKFSYTMYTVKDRMIVQYGGQTLYDTGCVSGSKTVSLNLSGTSDSVIVTVQPECEKKQSTQWNFKLECPK
jgi:hypothetical protein